MVRAGVRSPLASSCGRLFDAVSCLAGIAPERLEYEAEAAMRFEALADRRYRGAYPVAIAEPAPGRPAASSFAPLIRALVTDLSAGTAAAVVSSRFHDSLARTIVRVAERARRVMLWGLRLRGLLFRGERGRAYREAARWLRSGRTASLLESGE